MTHRDTEELAAALRLWRERLSPADLGLPAGSSRRRTPGLRREEVARVAGLSVDYVVRLEQSRGPQPSPSVLGALARALRLTAAETEHLFTLSGTPLPGPGQIRSVVRPSVLRLLDRMRDLPAMLVDARGDILAWNELMSALIGDLSALPPEHRSSLWLHFARDESFPSRVVADDGEGERLARSTVAQARTALARYPDDARLRRMVDTLRATSPHFAALWEERPVEHRRADTKSFDVPGIGRLTLDCERLDVPDDDQMLIVHSAAPGTPDAAKLDLLRVVGLQTTDAGP